MRLPRWLRRRRRHHHGQYSFIGGHFVAPPDPPPVVTPPVILNGQLELSASSYGVAEPSTFMTVYVNRTEGVDGAISVQYATADGTAVAGTDYTATSGTLHWADQDDNPKAITIPILSRLAAGTFDFSIALTNPGGGATVVPGGDTATLEIFRHGFGEADFSGALWYVTRPHSGPTVNLTVSVQRNLAFKGAVSVNYHTTDGTAIAGTDYTATSGTLNWTDQDGASKNIVIPILVHAAGADVQFTITIDTPTGGIVIGSINIATVTITDNASPPANPPVTASFPNQLITEYFLADDEQEIEEFSESNDNISVRDFNGQNNKFSTEIGLFNLRGVAFISNGTNGITVGENGLIFYTAIANAGIWLQGTSGISSTINAIAFGAVNTSNTTAIAVGNSGVILKSTDQGKTWTSKTSGTANHLYGVVGVTSTTFIAVGAGGTILISTDSGNTWNAQTSGTVQDLHGITWVPSTNDGWICGNNGTILFTTNTGTNWNAQTSGTSENLQSIWSPTSTTAWAVGTTGKIITTANIGTTWTSQTSGTSVTLRGVMMINVNVGYAVGDSGTILHTINGGVAWTAVTNTATGPFYSTSWTDSGGALWLAVGPNLQIYLLSNSTGSAPNSSPAGSTGTGMIGTPSATSNFGGGSDLFNTDAQAEPTSRLYMKGFAG